MKRFLVVSSLLFTLSIGVIGCAEQFSQVECFSNDGSLVYERKVLKRGSFMLYEREVVGRPETDQPIKLDECISNKNKFEINDSKNN